MIRNFQEDRNRMSDKGPPIPDLIGGGESYADRTYLDVSIEIEMYAAFSSKCAQRFTFSFSACCRA
jgi:hypothetical protein